MKWTWVNLLLAAIAVYLLWNMSRREGFGGGWIAVVAVVVLVLLIFGGVFLSGMFSVGRTQV